MNTLKQILAETQEQVSRGQNNGRHSEMKYREHPGMAEQRFRSNQGAMSATGNYPSGTNARL